MSGNSRFTVAIHIVTWMALVSERQEIMTSEQIAESVNTNPVVIRRLLGVLLKAHLVIVHHGPGAGWTLARPPEQITLRAIYDALEPGSLFPLHPTLPNQTCPVGKGIQPALGRFYGDAEAALLSQLAQTTIADVLKETLSASTKAVARDASVATVITT